MKDENIWQALFTGLANDIVFVIAVLIGGVGCLCLVCTEYKSKRCLSTKLQKRWVMKHLFLLYGIVLLLFGTVLLIKYNGWIVTSITIYCSISILLSFITSGVFFYISHVTKQSQDKTLLFCIGLCFVTLGGYFLSMFYTGGVLKLIVITSLSIASAYLFYSSRKLSSKPDTHINKTSLNNKWFSELNFNAGLFALSGAIIYTFII